VPGSRGVGHGWSLAGCSHDFNPEFDEFAPRTWAGFAAAGILGAQVLAFSPMGGSRGWRYAAAAFWIANGLNHFRAPKFYEAIVPPPFEPWKSEVNVASGAAELVGGLAVLPDRTRPAARWWLLATLLAVYWANVHMALRPDKFPRVQPALLYARLPVQGLFAWLTWRGTQ
jgi:uncharacterized membrane protein